MSSSYSSFQDIDREAQRVVEVREDKTSSKQCNDVAFAILFLAAAASIIGFAGVNIFSSGEYSWNAIHHAERLPHPRAHTLHIFHASNMIYPVIIFAIFSAVLCSLLFLYLARQFPKVIIWTGAFFFVGFMAIMAALSFYWQRIFGGVLFIILFVLGVVLLFFIHHFIAFNVLLIEIATDILFTYPSILTISAITLPVSFALILPALEVLAWTLSALQLRVISLGTGVILAIYTLLVLCWTAQVVRNVLHMTVCGAAASIFFRASYAPESPVSEAFGRAMTSSFGSICFGSLLVAIVETIRLIVEYFRRQQDSFIMCFIDCCLRCIEDIVRSFNFWVYSYLAIFGGTYCEAAQKTFWILASDGMGVLATYSLMGFVIFFGSFSCAIITFCIEFAIAGVNWPYVVLGTVLAFGISAIILCALSSVSATLFICLKESYPRVDAYLLRYEERHDASVRIMRSAADRM